MKKSFSFFFFVFFSFHFSYSQWVQKGGDIDGEAGGDRFGSSVSISSNGDIVAIGSTRNDGNGTDAGHVRIYDWNGSAWTQKGSDIDGESANDKFGNAIDLSSDGNRIAIGAPGDDGSAGNAGHVRVFDWNGSAWVQLGSDIDGEAGNDNSGDALDLSPDGSLVAISGPDNDGTALGAGHVRVYEWNGSTWTQKGNDIDGESGADKFGRWVAFSNDGSILAISAAQNDDGGNNSGHARVYEWNGSDWAQKGADIDGEAASDESGYNIALSADGTILAIGARFNDGNGGNSGHVRVYEWNGSAWIQKGSDIDGEGSTDESGFSVCLSSNGDILAIGARMNDGSGADAGHVRVYKWDGSSWVQEGSDIDGESAGDQSGIAIALTPDGSTIVIGGSGNDDAAGGAGHARVYSNPSILPVGLVDFKAIWNDNKQTEAFLSWTTKTEINNEFFFLEKSTDAIHFEDIARIDGAGNSQTEIEYSFIDRNIPEEDQNIFYRLRQVDFDGTITYSDIEVLQKEEGIEIITLYPNPNFGKFNVVLSSSVSTSATVIITDRLGKMVQNNYIEVQKGVTNIPTNLTEVSSGNYMLQIETAKGNYFSSARFILNE